MGQSCSEAKSSSQDAGSSACCRAVLFCERAFPAEAIPADKLDRREEPSSPSSKPPPPRDAKQGDDDVPNGTHIDKPGMMEQSLEAPISGYGQQQAAVGSIATPEATEESTQLDPGKEAQAVAAAAAGAADAEQSAVLTTEDDVVVQEPDPDLEAAFATMELGNLKLNNGPGRQNSASLKEVRQSHEDPDLAALDVTTIKLQSKPSRYW